MVEASPGITITEALVRVGEFGRFQMAACTLGCLMFTPVYYQMLITYFIAETTPAWRCKPNSTVCHNTNNTLYNINHNIYDTDNTINQFLIKNNIYKTYNNHSTYNNNYISNSKKKKDPGDIRCRIPRSEWEFIEPVATCSSIAVQYDIYCGTAWLLHLTTSMYFVGSVFGSILFAMFSDKYGRRIFALPCFLTTMTAVALSAFMPNIYWFMVCRFFTGLGGDSTPNTIVVLLCEYVTTRHRHIASNLPNLWYPFAVCLLTLQVYLIRDWKKLMLICSLPYLVLAPFVICLLPKSPYWLQANGRVEEAGQVCRKIGRMNKKLLRRPHRGGVSGGINTDTDNSIQIAQPTVKPKAATSIFELISTKQLFFKSTVLSFTWFTSAVLYFGLSLAASKLEGLSIYVNYIVVIVAEIPAGLLPFCLLPTLGRRLTVVGALFVGCVCSVMNLVFTLQDDSSTTKIAKIAISFVGKMVATLSLNAVNVWSVELYPTRMRGAGCGVFIIMSAVGGIAAPFIVEQLVTWNVIVPDIVLCSFAFIAASGCLMLPETKHLSADDDEENNRLSSDVVLRSDKVADDNAGDCDDERSALVHNVHYNDCSDDDDGDGDGE